MYLVDRSREKARTTWIYPYLQILSKLEPSEMHFCTVGWLVHIYNLWLHCETVTLSGTKVALPYDFHQLRSGNSNSQVVIGRSNVGCPGGQSHNLDLIRKLPRSQFTKAIRLSWNKSLTQKPVGGVFEPSSLIKHQIPPSRLNAQSLTDLWWFHIWAEALPSNPKHASKRRYSSHLIQHFCETNYY